MAESDQSDDNRVTEHEMYQNISTELETTHQKQLTAHESLTQKAIDVVKVNPLSLSLVATGLSVSDVEFSLLLVAGIFPLVYAVWASAHVFDPTEYSRGVSGRGGKEMDQKIQDGVSATEYGRTILYTYAAAIDDFQSKFRYERTYFTRSVWATFCGVVLLVAAAVNIVYLELPLWIDWPVVVCIGIVSVWGNHKSSRHQLDI